MNCFISSHTTEHSEDELREVMRDFMIQHIDWVTAVMSTVWKYTQLIVEDYIYWLTTPGVSMDFVGITILCSIYHIHVGVFFNNGAWSTSREKPLKSPRFGTVFHGNLEFTETVHAGWMDKYQQWSVSWGQQGKMPSHAQTSIPGLLKKELLPAQDDIYVEDDKVHDKKPDVKVKLPPKVERLALILFRKKSRQLSKCCLSNRNVNKLHYLSLHCLPLHCLKYGATSKTMLYWWC